MKRFSLLKNRNLSKWIGFIFSATIFGATIWYSNQFVSELKKEEQNKIENFAKAIQIAGGLEMHNSDVQNFLLHIIEGNQTMPVILLEDNGEVNQVVNISDEILNNPQKLEKLIEQMKNLHEPIEIDLGFAKQYVIYENSPLLTRLQYYPIILIIIIILFIYFSYWYFKTLKNTEQSYLWAGMAKETAHQIGTPLSSLLGWIEILKLENVDAQPIEEMEKDINRLNQITERFSKIGSLPELQVQNIVAATKATVLYLKARISKGIDIQFKSEREEIRIPLNLPLYSWVIENLVKNAADAMHNKGALSIYITDSDNSVEISIADTGPGIPNHLQKRIFEPGFTTKTRGWGLGLSLAKRIINDYHKGKIFVVRNNKQAGAEIKIILNK